MFSEKKTDDLSVDGDDAAGTLLPAGATAVPGPTSAGGGVDAVAAGAGGGRHLGGGRALHQRRRLRHVDARPSAPLAQNAAAALRAQNPAAGRRHLGQHRLRRHRFRKPTGGNSSNQCCSTIHSYF